MRTRGFTLAELLIALGILGIIAVFTIPKLIQNQSQSQYNAEAKEVASMLTGAFQSYKSANGNAYMRKQDLTPYLNYVSVVSVGGLDNSPNSFYWPSCDNAGLPGCVKLHNGGLLYYGDNESFCNNGSNPSAVVYQFDPDGVDDGKILSVAFMLYNNGAISTSSNPKPNTFQGSAGGAACLFGPFTGGNFDPSYLIW